VSQLIVSEFVTVDGVMEAPGGEPTHPHSGWVMDSMGQEQQTYKLAEVHEAGSLLIGRVTYESFVDAWPERTGEFADQMNSMPKHVVSSTLQDPEWNNTSVIRGHDLVEGVTALKAADAGPILVAGSATLVAALLEHNLVDELRLMVFPVLVGGGRRFFPESRLKQPLHLASLQRFATGVVVETYVPTR